jgi:hypothetical protein
VSLKKARAANALAAKKQVISIPPADTPKERPVSFWKRAIVPSAVSTPAAPHSDPARSAGSFM